MATDSAPEPPRRRRFTLSARIFWGALLLVCAPAAVAWAMGLYDAVETRRIGRALELVSTLAADTASARGLESPGWLSEFAAGRDVYVRVLDPAGEVRFASDPTYAEGRFSRRWWFRGVADLFFGPGGPPDLLSWEAELGPPSARPEVQAVLRGAPSAAEVRVTSKMLVFSRAVRVDGQPQLLYLTQISRRSVRALYDFRFQMLKLTLGLLFGALLMGGWLAYQVVSPVHRLESRVQDFLRGRDTGPLSLPRSDEIGDLSRSFDALRRRLQARIEHSTRVTEDFAHDLKSPLAAVRAAGELLDGEGPLPPERRARLAGTVAAAAAHMERSIEALMALARLEAQLVEEPKAPFDLAADVRALVEERSATPDPSGPTIELRSVPSVVVVGNRARLRQAVRNLLDNALGFARARVELEITVTERGLVVAVQDDGPGVSPGNRTRIFDRFFTQRPDSSPPGTGLGLSIVRAVAAAHGGDVALAEGEGGARFELTLPPNCLESARRDPPAEPAG